MFFVDLDNVDNSLRCIYVDDNIYTAFPKKIKIIIVVNNNHYVH